MIEIRPLHQDEIETAKAFVPAGDVEPEWKNCWAILDREELVGFFGMETRLIVEPMYMANGNHARQAYGAMTWIDGFMRTWAATLNKGGYEFFVGDNNPRFQKFIDEELPVRKGREKSGLYFFREFGV